LLKDGEEFLKMKEAREKTEKKTFQRKKVCRFCADKIDFIDYKDLVTLKNFLTERGKIIPRRISGNCSGHQRQLTLSIKRSRNIALLAFAEER
jgi:small subunit ribosomal protein S18